MDAYTEARIQEVLDEIRRDRTTLIIAHHFSTLHKADRIVGEATHDDLGANG